MKQTKYRLDLGEQYWVGTGVDGSFSAHRRLLALRRGGNTSPAKISVPTTNNKNW